MTMDWLTRIIRTDVQVTTENKGINWERKKALGDVLYEEVWAHREAHQLESEKDRNNFENGAHFGADWADDNPSPRLKELLRCSSLAHQFISAPETIINTIGPDEIRDQLGAALESFVEKKIEVVPQ